MSKKSQPIKRVLVANRGEIAVRIIRAAHSLGIEAVSVYSDADAGTLPVRIADRAVHLGASSAQESYLHQEKLINAAVLSGSDAVHPGYGFLAENAEFAQTVRSNGLNFVGPTPEVIAMMGDKDRARKAALEAGVPVVPGTDAGVGEKELISFGKEVGFPILIKAVAGGSGRGIRAAEGPEEVRERLEEAQREAQAAFGNPTVIAEKFIQSPRHIEVQVFGDCRGNVIHLLERDCSVQRRRQKLVEEAPAPCLNPELRSRICEAARSLAKAVGYTGAGTVEFLVEDGSSADDPFYFLEMNTRIQVEHPVTEEITGIDLVAEQLRIASGFALSVSQESVLAQGHSIELRIYAEDPEQNFKPQTGKVRYISRPGGPGIREDSWVEAGSKISAYYDSLLAKLIINGRDRRECLARARAYLDHYVLEGVSTTLPFYRWLLREPAFLAGGVDVTWLEQNYLGQSLQGSAVGPLTLPPEPNEPNI